MIGCGCLEVSAGLSSRRHSKKRNRALIDDVPGTDALYELLVIEVSHVDQIMSRVGVTSPMA